MTRINNLSRLRLLSAALLLCGRVGNAVAAVGGSASNNNNNNRNNNASNININNSNSNDNGGVISLQLTPRHVELERRRQRHLIPKEEDNSVDMDAAEENYRRRDEAAQIGALFEGYGTHYVDLWCGSPVPQRQTVIVDTGSGITAFPCGGCKDCGAPDYHIDRLFIEEESATFKESTCKNSADCIMDRSKCQGESCKVSMAYAEGSRWSAYEAVDACYVAGPHETPLVVSSSEGGSFLEGDDMNPRHAADLAFDMTFGCQTLVTGLFKTQLADGIMGMSNQKSTYWSQMFRSGKMGSDQQFALCFSRPPSPVKKGTEAGALTLGGVDRRLHLTPMVYTPAASGGRNSFFSVKVRRMMLRDGKFGESALSNNSNPNMGVTVLQVEESTLNKGGVIVDSGTTDTYWNRGISNEFQKVFTELAGRPHSNKGIKLTEEELLALPTILLQLYSDDDANSHIDDMFKTAGLTGALDKAHTSDVILAIPPSHYMEYTPEKDIYTSRFYPSENSGSVLGANAMMGHDVFFDMDNNRIGWAESDCDYTTTVKENGGYDFDITGELKDVEEAGSNSGDNKPPATPAECESFSSGAKCQKTDGCMWGWGKCTKTSDAPPETSAPTEADVPRDGRDPIPIPDSDSDIYIDSDSEELSVVDQVKEHAVGVGFTFVLLLVCCMIYCLWCRKDKRNSGKYARAALDPVSIEMTNGKNNNGNGNGNDMMPIDHHIDAFQDEPDEVNGGESDDSSSSSNDEESSSNKSKSKSKKTSSNFRDEPEFEGDFA